MVPARAAWLACTASTNLSAPRSPAPIPLSAQVGLWPQRRKASAGSGDSGHHDSILKDRAAAVPRCVEAQEGDLAGTGGLLGQARTRAAVARGGGPADLAVQVPAL